MPLRSTTGKLSMTGLITEAGLGRWKVYEHRDLVEEFQARVKAAGAVSDVMRDLAAEHPRLATELAESTAVLKAEQALTALLRRSTQ